MLDPNFGPLELGKNSDSWVPPLVGGFLAVVFAVAMVYIAGKQQPQPPTAVGVPTQTIQGAK